MSNMTLANAPIQVSSESNVELVLISAGVFVAIGILAFVPIQMTRSRGRRGEGFIALIVLWGLLTAGSICYLVMRQMDWSANYVQQIESGYLDPQNTSGKPTPPIALWTGMGIGYGGLMLWSARRAK